MRWMFAIGLLLLLALGILLVPQARSDREMRNGGGAVAESSAGTARGDIEPATRAVGTAGTHDGAAEAHAGDVITEIETITGTNDAMALVGRRVDLHVDVQHRANDHAFWVGPSDNRLLVILGRDTRDGSQRQRGAPSNHGIAPVRGGQRAAISGVIRPAPKAEDRYSWNLTRDDERELSDRKIYIDADTVSSEGHGSF
jgi:hypothetical protein